MRRSLVSSSVGLLLLNLTPRVLQTSRRASSRKPGHPGCSQRTCTKWISCHVQSQIEYAYLRRIYIPNTMLPYRLDTVYDPFFESSRLADGQWKADYAKAIDVERRIWTRCVCAPVGECASRPRVVLQNEGKVVLIQRSARQPDRTGTPVEKEPEEHLPGYWSYPSGNPSPQSHYPSRPLPQDCASGYRLRRVPDVKTYHLSRLLRMLVLPPDQTLWLM